MATIGTERVLTVHHWNETVFSFTTTRDQALRFENGHFVMLGMRIDEKPVMRAYSIASANHEEHLEFLSIKVPDGPLTSRLQHIKPGDEILISRKPTGTLLLHDLKPGKRLYLLSSGTGLAPFMSLIKDPEVYERFEKVILVHGVRYRSELAYRDYIEWELTHHEYLGELVREKLVYFPTVTRERFRYQGRVTALIETGSRMDELIFQEFKGTGNMEMVLDRKISDQRIYPAIDIFLSGTRREELLLQAWELEKINLIRRGLAGHKPEEAIQRLLMFVKKFPTNTQMLKEIPG